jgi:hypothetical protein
MGMERWCTTKRMFRVDPTTGTPVNGEEVHKEEMRYTDGKRKPVTAFAGDVKMREDYIEHTVALVKSPARPAPDQLPALGFPAAGRRPAVRVAGAGGPWPQARQGF